MSQVGGNWGSAVSIVSVGAQVIGSSALRGFLVGIESMSLYVSVVLVKAIKCCGRSWVWYEVGLMTCWNWLYRGWWE